MPISKYRLAPIVASIAAAAAMAPLGFQPALAGQAPAARSSTGTGHPAVPRAGAGHDAARVFLSARRGVAIAGSPARAAAGRVIMFSGGQRLTGGLTAPASVASRAARLGAPAAGQAGRAAPRTYKLTVTAIGRDGRPASDTIVDVVNTFVTGGDVHTLSTPHGTGSVKLPAGTYLVDGVIDAGPPSRTSTTLVLRTVKVSAAGANHVTLDARPGRLVDVTVDAPVSPSGRFQVVSAAYIGTRYGFTDAVGANPGMAYVVPAQGRQIQFGVQTVFRAAGAAGPAEYDLAALHRGGIPTDPAYHYHAARLAQVRNTYRASDAPSYGAAAWTPDTPEAVEAFRPAPLPITSVNYLSPGVPFSDDFQYGSARFPDRAEIHSDRAYTAGTHVSDVWDGAATGPGQRAAHATRDASTFSYTAGGFFTDGAPASLGHDGVDYDVTGAITLSAHGTVIAAEKYPAQQPSLFTATLPRAPATYTLTATARRKGSYAGLSTSVTAAWRFRSSYTAAKRPLPLLAVRYQVPGLNDHNQAPPGSTLAIPVFVTRGPGVPSGQVHAIAVESSTDSGSTWHRVPLHRAGSHWIADVTSPRNPRYVSLRATVTTAGGTSLTQTIIRAYAVTHTG